MAKAKVKKAKKKKEEKEKQEQLMGARDEKEVIEGAAEESVWEKEPEREKVEKVIVQSAAREAPIISLLLQGYGLITQSVRWSKQPGAG